MGTILGTIVFGAVIGVLARLVLPGKQHISVLMTVVLGIVGALVGYFVWGLITGDGFMGGNTGGIDWIRLIISVVVAAVLVSIYAGSAGRRRAVR
ncbi:GlsB/YeaQ/YmgE family stress response membrane protein [Angustibacter speluncae]